MENLKNKVIHVINKVLVQYYLYEPIMPSLECNIELCFGYDALLYWMIIKYLTFFILNIVVYMVASDASDDKFSLRRLVKECF